MYNVTFTSKFCKKNTFHQVFPNISSGGLGVDFGTQLFLRNSTVAVIIMDKHFFHKFFPKFTLPFHASVITSISLHCVLTKNRWFQKHTWWRMKRSVSQWFQFMHRDAVHTLDSYQWWNKCVMNFDAHLQGWGGGVDFARREPIPQQI